jgi:hypothetical protein
MRLSRLRAYIDQGEGGLPAEASRHSYRAKPKRPGWFVRFARARYCWLRPAC